MTLWIDDIRELFKFDIWPCPDDTYTEKVNAISRFVLMSTCILAVHRKSPRLFIAGILLSVAIALRARNVEPTPVDEAPVIEPTPDDELPQEEVSHSDAPVPEYVDGVDSFAHFVYGDINRNKKQK